MERTLILVKPDGIERLLIGQIISRFEQRGLKLVGLKLMQVSEELAKEHYAEHVERPFFGSLISYITSAPVVAMAWAGPNAAAIARKTIGATKPVDAAPGTIRGDFGMEIGRNLVHGSDSPESGAREVGIWFSDSELVSYDRTLEPWILE